MATKNILEDYFKMRTTTETEYKGSRAKGIIKLNALNKANKIESTPFEGLPEKINEILDNSESAKLRIKLGKTLALKGVAALGLLPFGDKYFVEMLDIVTYTKIGKFDKEVTGTTTAVYLFNGANYPIYTKYFFKEGKPTLRRFIQIQVGEKTEQFITEGDITFDGDKLPVEIFEGNIDGQPDIDFHEVRADLDRLEYLDSQQVPDYHMGRDMMFFNENFTENDPDKTTKNMVKGKRTITEDSMNGQYGSGTQKVPATGSVAVVMGMIAGLEIDIYKKLGLESDIAGGNNKVAIEIILKDPVAAETIQSLRQMREASWNHFFEKIGSVIGVTVNKVELKLSTLEQAKYDYFKAQMAGELAKSTANGQGQPEEETATAEEE